MSGDFFSTFAHMRGEREREKVKEQLIDKEQLIESSSLLLLCSTRSNSGD